MKNKCLFRLMVALFMVFAIRVQVLAGEPTERIKETTDKIIAVLTDPALSAADRAAERRRIVREAVDERFDWETISRMALARHWRKRTDEEKREFIQLFGKLLERTYMNKVENYSGEKVYYIDEIIDRDDKHYGVVKVKIVTDRDEELSVDYRVKNNGDDWFVYDVSIESVSLVNNYRVQFNHILMKSSYQELVKRLKEKVAQE